jgi:hypothetical protein
MIQVRQSGTGFGLRRMKDLSPTGGWLSIQVRHAAGLPISCIANGV